MVQHQKAGDKLYVDFAGKKLEIVDPSSGEVTTVEVFIAVLGASQYAYAEAVYSQKKADFLRAIENALHFFGGVPKAIVPDNLKAAVTKASRYEPLLNETLEDFAHHYGTVILPARSRKPQDKALVERTVTLVYQRIYARLRNEVFFSLRSLNDAIGKLLPYLNEASFQGRSDSRATLFAELDQPVLRPLPRHRYEWKYYQAVTVLKNYHVFLKEDSHYYSVPYRYVKKKVKIAYTSSSVEVYCQHERIAIHARSRRKYQYSTLKEHMPSAHRFVSDWCPEKFIRWAARISPVVEEYISQVLAAKAHPEQGYKSCIGILSFEKKVGKERLTAACQRGLSFQSYGYQVIKNILSRGLDQLEEPPETTYRPPEHENIRGQAYYQ
jgi:transposase